MLGRRGNTTELEYGTVTLTMLLTIHQEVSKGMRKGAIQIR